MTLRKLPKKRHDGLLALVVMILLFGGLAFLVASPQSNHTPVQPSKVEDAFYGKIINMQFRDKMLGTVRADTNCKMVQNGLTNCVAIIASQSGTELHFDYTHDMSRQPCLAPGDYVTITLQSDGTVKVVRG